jgi:hypothetical protein
MIETNNMSKLIRSTSDQNLIAGKRIKIMYSVKEEDPFAVSLLLVGMLMMSHSPGSCLQQSRRRPDHPLPYMITRERSIVLSLVHTGRRDGKVMSGDAKL